MRVFLASSDQFGSEAPTVAAWRQLAAASRERIHELLPRPEDADIVLFTECHLLGSDWRLAAIRSSSTYRAFADRAMVYDERDVPWCSLPGVYVSMPSAFFRPGLQRSWGYYLINGGGVASDQEPDLLFSFAGSLTHGCRLPLFELKHDRAIIERVEGFVFFDPTSKDFEFRRGRHREVIDRSKFVLCPRGQGTSSIRMYEALAVGRVPVIISDDWVPPDHVDLSGCTLRWPEGRTDGLLEMLERAEERWPKMSTTARQVHQAHFAREVAFDQIVGLCADLQASRADRGWGGGLLDPGWRNAGAHLLRRQMVGLGRSTARRVADRLLHERDDA